IDLFERVLGFQREHLPEERLRRLEDMLTRYGLDLPAAAPLFAALLSLPPPAHNPPPALTPEQQRRRTLEAVVMLLRAATEQQPLLLVVEDLHWVDPTTLELLGLMLEQAPTARVLVLLICRPEFAAPWPARAELA